MVSNFESSVLVDLFVLATHLGICIGSSRGKAVPFPSLLFRALAHKSLISAAALSCVFAAPPT